MNHRVSDFSLFNCNILFLSHNNATPQVPEEGGRGTINPPSPQFLADKLAIFQPGGGGILCPPHYYPPDFWMVHRLWIHTVANARRVVSHNNNLDSFPAKTNSIFLQGLLYIGIQKPLNILLSLLFLHILIKIKSQKLIICSSYPTKISNGGNHM